jgi:hypothetical protein
MTAISNFTQVSDNKFVVLCAKLHTHSDDNKSNHEELLNEIMKEFLTLYEMLKTQENSN